MNRDFELTGNEEGKQIMITASDSLEDRYDPNVSLVFRCGDVQTDYQVGAIRSWDQMTKVGDPKSYTRENTHEHYLTIIDNMVNQSSLLGVTSRTDSCR